MSKKKETNQTYEVVRHMRGDWGQVNPVTKIIRDKKKDHKLKYPKQDKERKIDDYV